MSLSLRLLLAGFIFSAALPFAVAEDDMEASSQIIQKLQSQRSQYLEDQLKRFEAEFEVGTISGGDYLKAIDLLKDAELASADTELNQLSVWETARSRVWNVEKVAYIHYQMNCWGGEEILLMDSRTARLDYEFEIVQLRHRFEKEPVALEYDELFPTYRKMLNKSLRELVRAQMADLDVGMDNFSSLIAQTHDLFATELDLADDAEAVAALAEHHHQRLRKLKAGVSEDDLRGPMFRRFIMSMIALEETQALSAAISKRAELRKTELTAEEREQLETLANMRLDLLRQEAAIPLEDCKGLLDYSKAFEIRALSHTAELEAAQNDDARRRLWKAYLQTSQKIGQLAGGETDRNNFDLLAKTWAKSEEFRARIALIQLGVVPD